MTADTPISAPPIADATGVKEVMVMWSISFWLRPSRRQPGGCTLLTPPPFGPINVASKRVS
jgi:hypothetical protein